MIPCADNGGSSAGREHLFEPVLALSAIIEECDLGCGGFGTCVSGGDEGVVSGVDVPHAYFGA